MDLNNLYFLLGFVTQGFWFACWYFRGVVLSEKKKSQMLRLYVSVCRVSVEGQEQTIVVASCMESICVL